MDTAQTPSYIVINNIAKAKKQDAGTVSKSETLRLKNLILEIEQLKQVVSPHWKKILQYKSFYPKNSPPIKRYRRLQAFKKYTHHSKSMVLTSVDKLASLNNGVNVTFALKLYNIGG